MFNILHDYEMVQLLFIRRTESAKVVWTSVECISITTSRILLRKTWFQIFCFSNYHNFANGTLLVSVWLQKMVSTFKHSECCIDCHPRQRVASVYHKQWDHLYFNVSLIPITHWCKFHRTSKAFHKFKWLSLL